MTHARHRITILTGATGFLGREILGAVLASRPEEELLLFVRGSKGRSAQERVAKILDRLFPEFGPRADAARRVRVLETDLARDDSALPEEIAARVRGRSFRVIHGAASVAFDLPLEQARRINVDGTRRMLAIAELAARHGRLERFGFISTAFVAGDREGRVYEDELDDGQAFTNTYERTKLESERIVREARKRLPTVIFRPSIVAGHSITGETSDFKVLYWPLKVFTRGLVLCIPGDPDSCYDIVPVDFVSEALLHILERDDCRGRTFHLTVGRTVTLQQAVDLASSIFEVRRVPPFVSPKRFYAILRPILWLTLIGPARRVMKTGDVYIPYLSKRLIFDNTNTASALKGSSIRVPDVETYLKTIFVYAKQTDFGRRDAASYRVATHSGDGAAQS